MDKAARVEALAGGGQVLISEETKTLAKPKEAFDWGLWELKGLEAHRIYEVLWPGRSPSRPSGRAVLQPKRYETRFVGRERELQQIMAAVKGQRLVTLKGMGGIGKTRLADEVAARLAQVFEDGVFWVELAQTGATEAAVISEVRAKLDANPEGFPDEATALLSWLRNRRTLLVLNNFENVMAGAPFVGHLVRGCPGLHCLITSQKSLGLEAEQQIPIEPMPVSGRQPEELDSFQLFRDRAR